MVGDSCPTHRGPHRTVDVTVSLAGACEKVPDYPIIPLHLSIKPYPFRVFDAELYRNTAGYCTGDDEVSRAVIAQGRWEGYETSLALDILTTAKRGWMLDIGSHVGWYSTIAAKCGHSVLAYDADAEHLEALMWNTLHHPVTPYHCWIDENTAPLHSPFGTIHLVKIDLEGHEPHALRMIWPLLDHVRFIMMEVSPEFSAQGDVISPLHERGFDAYVIPDKGYPHTFAEPIRETMANPWIWGIDAIERQCSMLFVNTGMWP